MESNNTHQTSSTSALNPFKSKQDGINSFKLLNDKNSIELIDLHQAVRQGSSVNQIKALIRRGAKLDSKDRYGNTLLHTAAWYGYSDVAIFLINEGVDLEARNNYGHTPLHAAVQNGHFKIVGQLLNKGADVEVRDHKGNTPLHLIVLNYFSLSRVKLVVGKLLEKSVNLEAKNNDGYTVLQLAAQHASVNLINFLVASGADLAVRDVDGNTLLHLAVSESQSRSLKARLKVVRYLVHIGTDLLAAKNNYGDTALHTAVSNYNLKLVDLLLNRGAVLEAKNNDGDTVLHIATSLSEIDMVRFLVEKGADLRAKNNDGYTALHIATEIASIYGDIDIVRFLVEKGADLRAKNNDGDTALDIARLDENKNVDLVKYLESQTAFLERRSIDESTSNPILTVIEDNSTMNGVNRASSLENKIGDFFKQIYPLEYAASSTSSPQLASHGSQIHHTNIQTGGADLNDTLLLANVLVNKLIGAKHNNTFFKEEPVRSNLAAGDQIMDAINSFPSKLDSMEEKQGFNRTFKL